MKIESEEHLESLWFKEAPNVDPARMQALPWREVRQAKCHELRAANGKEIGVLFGNDKCHPDNKEWCTEAQRFRHAAYIRHACNNFPIVQEALVEIANMAGVPEHIMFLVTQTLEHTYAKETPPYA